MRNVTGVAATDVLTVKDHNGVAVNHGFRVGHKVILGSLTGGNGLTAGTIYHVIEVPTDRTLKISETAGGASVNFSTDLTAGTIRKRIPGSLNSRRNL